MLIKIPNKIGNAKTLFIAETDGVFDVIERDEKKIEIIFITVCQYDGDEGFYLFGCDKYFNTHTDFYYNELEEALEDATRIYEIKQINWRQYLPNMEVSDTKEIYVSIIDGTQSWIPIKVKRQADNNFLILNNNEFDSSDYSCLPEFIPGDVVSTEEKIFEPGYTKKVANKIISASPHPDKSFFEFLYQATNGNLSQTKETEDKYRNEIDRVMREFSNGRYFYPNILKTIEELNKL